MSLLRAPISEMTYTVSSGTLNSNIPYHTYCKFTLIHHVQKASIHITHTRLLSKAVVTTIWLTLVRLTSILTRLLFDWDSHLTAFDSGCLSVFKSRLKTFSFTELFLSLNFWSDLLPAALKLRPYGAICIRLLLLIIIGVLCFTPKQVAHDWRVGGSRPNQNDYVFFYNTCNVP